MKPRRHRGIATGIIALLILIVGVGGAVLFMNLSGSAAADRAKADHFTVVRGNFDITIPTSGELAAQNQTEIKNLLETNAMITEIIDEGTFVRKGDVLFRLNDEDIRNRIIDATDAVDQTRNQLENAEANLEISRKSRESQMSEAELRIRLAERAKDAWINGTDVSRQQELELAIKTSEMNYERAKNRYESSVELAREEFISQDELKGDEIALLERESQYSQAKLAHRVYMDYNRLQEEEKLESEVNQANDEKLRIDQRTKAEVSSAESDVESRKRQLTRDQERLDKLETQLEYCVVRAPTDGLVVYRSSLNRDRRDNTPPEVGTQLSRSETVMVLPDITNMVAEVKINEALSGQVDRGQPATIISDAYPDRVFTGKVLSVGVLAEGGGWRDPNRRDYTVRISIDDVAGAGLKPSMRCKANILVARVNDVVYVPVPAVFRRGPVSYVYMPDGDGYSEQEVQIGNASELYVEIVSGLEPGQKVLVREPTADEIRSTIDVPETTLMGSVDDVDPASADDSPPAARSQGDNQRGSENARPGSGGQRGGMSDEDRNRMREEALKKYDTDGDGQLSDEERAVMMQDMQNRRGGGTQ